MYASSVWGFTPERWSALGFSRKGIQLSLLARLRSSDSVLLIGTKGDETEPGEQGKLLGLVRLLKREIPTRYLADPHEYLRFVDARGQPKWPYGIPFASAERFVGPPLPNVSDVIPRIYDENLGIAAATGVVELTDEEAARVLGYPTMAVENLYRSPESDAVLATETWRDSLRRHSRGPAPRQSDYVVGLWESAAFTYCFEFIGPLHHLIGRPPHELGKRKLLKIGWSIDPTRRLGQINAYFPEPRAAGWKLRNSQRFDDRKTAYVVEQRLLRALASSAWRDELVLCDEPTIDSAWAKCLGAPLTAIEIDDESFDRQAESASIP